MHLYLQFNGRFTAKADRIARIFQERYGFDKFSGLSTSEGHSRWLGRPANTPIRYEHVLPLPELWRETLARGRPRSAERLAELERRYGTLWRYVMADRNLSWQFFGDTRLPRTDLKERTGSYDVVLACIEALFDYFEQAFLKSRPDAALFQNVASGPSMVAGAVCGKMGIPFFSGCKTHIGDLHTLAANVFMQPDEAMRHYADPAFEASAESFEWVDKYAGQTAPTDYYERDRANLAQRFGGDIPRVVARMLAGFGRAAMPPKKPYPPDPRAPSPLDAWWHEARVQAWHRAYRMTGVFDRGPVAGDFAYFPLCYTPESSTSIMAPHLVNQVLAVQAVAQGLPAGWRLAVKDHLHMAGARRRPFYDALRRLPNVVLLDPAVRSSDLARDSRAVVLIAGTTGWEAVLMGKPVVVMSDMWYLALGTSVRCHSLETVAGDIDRAVRLAASVPAAERRVRLARMVEALRKTSFPFSYEIMWDTLTPDKLAAYQAELEGCAAHLHRRWQDAASNPVDPMDSSGWSRDRTPRAAERKP